MPNIVDTAKEFKRLKDELGTEGARESLRRRYGQEQERKSSKYMRHVDPGGALGDALGRYGSAGGYSFGQYKSAGKDARDAEEMLRRRAMGEESLSAEQLRQGLMQNVAAQRSMAAGASPRNAAAANRNAMLNASRMGSGLAGQQAMAGIAERQAAQDALTRAIMQRRGQDLQGGLGYGGLEMQGLGTAAQERLGHRGLGKKGRGPGLGTRAIGAAAPIAGAIVGGVYGGPGGAAAGYGAGKAVGDSVKGDDEDWV